MNEGLGCTPDVTRLLSAEHRRAAGITFSVERILAPGSFGGGKRPKEGTGWKASVAPEEEKPPQEYEEAPSERKPPEDPGEALEKLPVEPPIWIFCSRFSARPTAGPRRRSSSSTTTPTCEDRRCRTAFTARQVSRLRSHFQQNEYLSEVGRRELALELGLTEAQVKIWFQNARAKRRRSSGGRRSDSLAMKLAEAGLYNHSAHNDTTPTR